MVLVLLFDLLNDSFYLNRLSIVDAQVVLVVLKCSAHAVKRFSDLATLVSNQSLGEEALGTGVVVAA